MKKQNGITLIALIVTIIVLLILVGIAITVLTGQNGILDNAKDSKEQYIIQGIREKLNLELNNIIANNIVNGIENSRIQSLQDFSSKGYATQEQNNKSYIFQEGYTFEIEERANGQQEVVFVAKGIDKLPIILTFEYNDATERNGELSKEVMYGSTYGNLPGPIKTGYTFNGWYKESSCVTQVESDTIVSTANNHTIYAKWTANELTFSSQAKSVTYSSNSQTVIIDGASDGTEAYTYTEKSEKNASNNEDTNYISIEGTTITLLAKTPAGTYYYLVTAKDNNSEKTKDATITITVNKANMETPTVLIDTQGVVTWNSITGATSYEISFDNSTWETATSGSRTVSTTSSGTHTAYVRAVTTNSNYNTPSTAGNESITLYSLILNIGTGIASITGGGYYVSGTKVTITATANSGYKWSKWTVSAGNTPVDVNQSETEVTITGNTTLQATATENTVTLKVTKDGSWWMYTDVNCTNKSGTLTLKSGNTYKARDMGWINSKHIYYLKDKGKYIIYGSSNWSVQ